MRRVMVLGSPGAGKSTFASQLGDATGLPVYHLDAYYWRPGWTAPTPARWRAEHDALIERDAWIVDGNYSSTIDARFERADTAILLRVPRAVALYRVVKRRLEYNGQSRPTMAPGCPERLDQSFLWYTARFNRRRLPALEARMRAEDLAPIVLDSSAERRAFLAGVSSERSESLLLGREGRLEDDVV